MTDTNASTQQLRAWVGRKLVDPGGGKIGSIEDIYMDDATGKPEWLAVKTGWFGHRVSFVPIVGASPGNGGDIVSRWDKAHVKDAPHAEPDGQLTVDEEADLYRHYGIQYAPATGTAGGMGTAPATDQAQARAQMEAQARGRAEAAAAGAPGTAGTPDARAADVVRSEEELEIDKQQHEAGTVRLRKWVETEHVTRTVPVSHEEAHLRREPIGADEAAGMGDADMAEADQGSQTS
jgi:hypothetical protein